MTSGESISLYLFLEKVAQMKRQLFLPCVILVLACQPGPNEATKESASLEQDSLVLRDMIKTRERSMIDRDLPTAMSQFSSDATWINSQGYYFVGKEEIGRFHNMLASADTVDYFYEAGQPYIRMVDPKNALVYYGGKCFGSRLIPRQTRSERKLA